MKHPDRDEWIPWIFGEADQPTRQRLSQHLAACPDCAREIAGWRRSLRQLDRWTVPRSAPRQAFWFQPALKWAVAALLMLGVGYLIGRTGSPSAAERAAWRQDVEASVRASLKQDLASALQEIQGENSNAIFQAQLHVTKVSEWQRGQFWDSLMDALAAARAQDAQAFRTLLQQSEERQDSQFVSLRRDLETLASLTDEEIRRAKLIQLTSLSPTRE